MIQDAFIFAAGLALLVLAVECARTNKARGLAHIAVANGLLAAAAAALAGAPFIPSIEPLACAGALAVAVLLRILVDRRLCPRHLRPWPNPERWRFPP